MTQKPAISLFTPPLLQLNTPYPATAVLKGYLQEYGYDVYQADLGIEWIHQLFCKKGLKEIFDRPKSLPSNKDNQRIYHLRDSYINSIDTIIDFLKNPNTAVATRIINRDWLPEGRHFKSLQDEDLDYGPLGIIDHAKHIATLVLLDISDFIRDCIDPGFEFIRYASKISTYLPTIDPLLIELDKELNLIQIKLLEILDIHLQNSSPKIVGFTVPFPGNLLSTIICARHIKMNYPDCVVVIGGGYPTTELRTLSDSRIFDWIDYIVLDEGEASLLSIIQKTENTNSTVFLNNCLERIQGKVVLHPKRPEAGIKNTKNSCPDFAGLDFNQYLSLIEFSNPMHRLWSDGKWIKMTLARGCYWGKCAFCDTQLSYIRHYRPLKASTLVDHMEEVMRQTGQASFHFTDEAAPPSLLRDLSLEILNRKLNIAWWTNIRFEKSFTADLCRLMALAGCIAITRGIETASDRLLKKMNKGVSLEQAALTCHHFTEANIMVHAYLMYGFPGQTVKETIDALEIVRQFFELGLIQSAFWHRFALTVHSTVYSQPDEFGIKIKKSDLHPFANNESDYEENESRSHEKFDEGLKTAIFNFMRGAGLEKPVHTWFRQKFPSTTHAPYFIQSYLNKIKPNVPKEQQMIYWPGLKVEFKNVKKTALIVHKPSQSVLIHCPEYFGRIFNDLINNSESNQLQLSVKDFENNFAGFTPPQHSFWESTWCLSLQQAGMLIL